MSKLTKLVRSPKAFFTDAVRKRQPDKATITRAAEMRRAISQAQASGRPVAVLVGFSNWKNWMSDALPHHHVVMPGPKIDAALLDALPRFPSATVYTWSYKAPAQLRDVCARANIPLVFVEDGFIRGFGLGVAQTRPMSLAFDARAMHFDRHNVSELDMLLNSNETFSEPDLERARRVMSCMRAGLTKYNDTKIAPVGLAEKLRLDPDRRTIVVLGQIEDDLSLAYGMDGKMSGNDLVARVAMNNPHAQILYRPHPESFAVTKPHYSKPQDVAHLAHIVPPKWSLRETLSCAQEAHTITSLSGFEAAIHGLEVHTYGMPFYAGWGFTTDHGLSDVPGKRTRARSLLEVACAAYVRYPRYYHPITGQPISIDQALECINAIQTHAERMAGTRAAAATQARVAKALAALPESDHAHLHAVLSARLRLPSQEAS